MEKTAGLRPTQNSLWKTSNFFLGSVAVVGDGDSDGDGDRLLVWNLCLLYFSTYIMKKVRYLLNSGRNICN